MEAATIQQGGASRTDRQPNSDGARAIGVWKPADPAPLGLAGFAMTTFVLSMFNANLVSERAPRSCSAWLWPTAGSCSCSRACGSSAPATHSARSRSARTAPSGSPSGRWRSSTPSRSAATSGTPSSVSVGWAIFTAYMTVAALRVSGAVLAVFALLTATFMLLAIGAVGAHDHRHALGRLLGLATAAAAWYASFAAVTNSTFGRTVLPVMPLGAERRRTAWAWLQHGWRPNGRASAEGKRGGARWPLTGARASCSSASSRAARGRPSSPAAFREHALLNDPAVYEQAARDPHGWWARRPRELTGSQPWEHGSRRLQPAVLQVVRRRQAQRVLQLSGPPRAAGRGERVALPLAGRGGRGARHHLRGAARRRQALRQRAEGPRRAARATSSGSTCR